MLCRPPKSLGKVALFLSFPFFRLGGLLGGGCGTGSGSDLTANWFSFAVSTVTSMELTESASEDRLPIRLDLLLLGGGLGAHSLALITGGSEVPLAFL